MLAVTNIYVSFESSHTTQNALQAVSEPCGGLIWWKPSPKVTCTDFVLPAGGWKASWERGILCQVKQKWLRQVEEAADSFYSPLPFVIRAEQPADTKKTLTFLQLFVYSPCVRTKGSSVQSGGAAPALLPAGGRKMPQRVTVDVRLRRHLFSCSRSRRRGRWCVQTGKRTLTDKCCRTRKKTLEKLKFLYKESSWIRQSFPPVSQLLCK